MCFPHELPEHSVVQFLDLKITFCGRHAFWGYYLGAKKRLLPFDLAHSKTIKRAVVLMCLESALRKSCLHRTLPSFENQGCCLLHSGFPNSVLIAVSETLLQKLKRGIGSTTTENHRKVLRPEVVPYVHKLSHNLKRVSSRHWVPVCFSASSKLGSQ